MSTVMHQDPLFGWDPWPNAQTNPTQIEKAHLTAATGIFNGADTIGSDIGLLPNGLNMYASYIDGYGGWSRLVAARESSGAFLLSITIHGGAAHCGDVEPGAMSASELPYWLDHVALPAPDLDPSIPWVYTSASMMSTVNRYIGGRNVIRWSAHYGFGAHICGPHTCGYPQADWTQWDNAGAQGQNIDRSIGRILPTPIPQKPDFASGTASFSGQINFDTGAWSIQAEPGSNIKWGTKNVRWSAEIQVDGSNGTWDAQSLPYNAEIPTTGANPKPDPATGVAHFAGSINFDSGVWSVRGTAGAPNWGAKEQWSAVVKIDNRFGDWHIIGCPFNAPPLGG